MSPVERIYDRICRHAEQHYGAAPAHVTLSPEELRALFADPAFPRHWTVSDGSGLPKIFGIQLVDASA